MVRAVWQRVRISGSIIFARWHQCAPCNVCFVLPTRVRAPKRHLDWSAIFAQLTQCHWACLGMFFPLKIAPSRGDLDMHRLYGSFSPPEPTTEMASRSVQPFLHSSREIVPILYSGPPFHSKLPLPIRTCGPLSNTWFLWLTQVLNPNSISISSAICAGLTSVTDHTT